MEENLSSLAVMRTSDARATSDATLTYSGFHFCVDTEQSATFPQAKRFHKAKHLDRMRDKHSSRYSGSLLELITAMDGPLRVSTRSLSRRNLEKIYQSCIPRDSLLKTVTDIPGSLVADGLHPHVVKLQQHRVQRKPRSIRDQAIFDSGGLLKQINVDPCTCLKDFWASSAIPPGLRSA
ncbi:hypothetical protein C8R44DRAFT_747040 [Mycena epipterygia]|nr:hypothetical protein C8R44DRAFT_747040 [Mycena epipterygia]